MAWAQRLWVPVMVGCLVAGVLGVGSGEAVAVEPRTVTASIMVPATAFIPNSGSVDYFSTGLVLQMLAGNGYFSAPLSFPVPVVSIRRITLYAYDNDAGGFVGVVLGRTRPVDGVVTEAAHLHSADGPANPQAVYTTVISPRRFNTALHGAHLWMYLAGPNVRLYGVKVTYAYNPEA